MTSKEQLESRRNFIKQLGAAGLLMSMGLPSYAINPLLDSHLEYAGLPQVKVTPERVTREVVGLRPYRPSGYNMSTQKLDEKLIIHNYGHGGGGISLSWGTAKLAIDNIETSLNTKIAVLGAGVIGLSTAILLLKQGRPVTIYTDKLPPETTSNVAAAFWAPVSVFESDKISPGFMDNFNEASRISQRMFQDLVGSRYGVWWIKTYFLGGNFDFPGGKKLYPDYKRYNAQSSPFSGYGETEEVHSLMIEPPIYLRALLDDFHQLGGKLVVQKFNQTSELTQLNESVIMNCTGLGAHHLFKDEALIPVQGQLAVLLPQEEITYGYVYPSYNDLLYMFPRKDGIILGGNSAKNVWTKNTDEVEISRILKGHQRIANGLRP